MAVLSQLEYRFNLFADAIVQPFLTSIIEITLWSAILASTGSETFAGFPKSSYVAYALWAAFFSRITTNWMYEYRMIDEIETGTVNSILARPISFYEYYLGQFLGYKFLTTAVSIVIPIVIVFFISGPTDLSRLPLSLALISYFLIFAHTLSFAIASFAFYFNRIHSFTVAKNIALWVLMGELFPLDLMPEKIKQVVLALPFASGVYIPVGYLTGRIGADVILQGFISVTAGIAVVGLIANLVWTAGRKAYSGTGA